MPLITNANSFRATETGSLPHIPRYQDPRTLFDPSKVESEFLPDNIEKFKAWATSFPGSLGVPAGVPILDLHGFSCSQAYFVVREFLMKCHLLNYTDVFIMTGRGIHSINGYSPLYNNLPDWLDEISTDLPLNAYLSDFRDQPGNGYYIGLEGRQRSRQNRNDSGCEIYYSSYNSKPLGNRRVNQNFDDFVCRKLKGLHVTKAERRLEKWELKDGLTPRT